MQTSILVLASGEGRRFGGETPKVYLPCGGISLLQRSVQRLHQCCPDAEIILAIHPEHRQSFLQPILPALQQHGLSKVIEGGASRLQSMQRALQASNPEAELVLIHDAARPFFPIQATHEALQKASQVGAALLAIPAADTLKRVDEQQQVLETMDRSQVWLAQTPQVLQRKLLLQALNKQGEDQAAITDDVSLIEAMGGKVAVVLGHSWNIKITTPQDLQLAQLICQVEKAN